jgi:phosphate uptake regulator
MAEREISKLGSVFAALIDDAISVLIHADSEKANELIDKNNEVKRQSMNIVNLSQEQNRDEMLVKLVIANSIERMLDYIINIAELTINMHSADLENEATRE